MKIEAVDAFYLAMPQIAAIADGSQDMLLVRVVADGRVGWGESEASPLPSIASLVCPMSHSACRPVLDSVLGEHVDAPEDITRIVQQVRANSLDLLQASHTLSGIEIALWDLLGKIREQPVYELLGDHSPAGKTAYASALFGDDPQSTLDKARRLRADGFDAVKFGWGPYGVGDAAADTVQVAAAREGLGPTADLLVDAGTVWVQDVQEASLRLEGLQRAGVRWLEEPFVSGALSAYKELAVRCRDGLRLAAGEGAHHPHMAEQLIDHAGIGYIQIDAGRVGGISEARRVARYAHARGVQFVNHTFTSHLALSASLQAFAAYDTDNLCEYPVELSALARSLVRNPIELDSDGLVRPPDGPGLGIELDLVAVRPYLMDVEIVVNGRELYRTPELSA